MKTALQRERALLARLQESEERFRTLVETTTDWMWETDENHCLSWLSPTLEARVGVPASALLGKPRWAGTLENQESNPAHWRSHKEDLSAHRSFRDFRYWLKTDDGPAKWLSISGAPRFDETGAFLGYRGTGSDITARAAMSLRLRTLSAVVDQSPVSVVITDPQGVITYVNPHFSTVTGYSSTEVIGRTPRLIASGDTPRDVYGCLWKTIKSGETWAGELKNRRKDGTFYWEDEVIFPITNDDGKIVHFVGIKEDITYRKQAEAKLAEQRRRFELILSSAGEGICGVDPEGRITFINAAARRLLGRDDDEGIGLQLHEWVHPCRADGSHYSVLDCPIHQTLTDGKTRQVSDVVFWRKNGSSFPVEYTVTAMVEADLITGAVSVFRDITDRLRLTTALEQLARCDPLTGLANRRAFDDAAKAEFERYRRFGTTAAVLIIDVDHFKQVNDLHGHEAGDRALIALASLLSSVARGTDLPARYGGEEFTVLLVGTGLAGAVEVAERIREAAARTKVASPSGEFGFTVSIGATVFDSSDDDWSKTLQRADECLYQAKATGRNRVVVDRPISTAR